MPRKPRTQEPWTLHHVTSRAVAGGPLFLDDADREWFLETLAGCRALTGWSCLAYALTAEAYHLLIELSAPNLSSGMQRLNCRYANHFNHRHGYTGHVFGSRFRSTLIEDDEHAVEALGTIVLAPVRDQLCERAGDWRWSSYGALLRREPDPAGVGAGALRLLNCDRASFVTAVERARRWPGRPPLAVILNGGGLADIDRAQRVHGYRLADIARHLGVSTSTAWRRVNAARWAR